MKSFKNLITDLKSYIDVNRESGNKKISYFIKSFKSIPFYARVGFYNYILKRSQKHKFHIVSPSPWPFLTSLSAFVFVMGMVAYMHQIGSGGLILGLGVFAILFSMYFWFRDIIREAALMCYHTRKVQLGLRMGFLLFIVSEIMFFFSFFWSYFHFSCCPSSFAGGIWPPEGIIYYVFEDQSVANDATLLYPRNSYYLEHSSNIGKLNVRDSWWEFLTFGGDSQYFYKFSNDALISGGGFYDNLFLEWLITECKDTRYVDYTGNYGTRALPWFDTIAGASLYEMVLESVSHNINDTQKFLPIPYIILDVYEKQWEDYFNNSPVLKLLDESEELTSEFRTALMRILNTARNGSAMVNISLTLIDPGSLVHPYSIPLANTIILLGSSIILTLSHNNLKLGRYGSSIFYLILTVIFGLLFFGFQLSEYSSTSFSINDGVYGSTFYMLTGFHGFHVFIGTVFLNICLIRMFQDHFTPTSHFGFEAAIWYWHFVDVVWIFLFLFIYVWPNHLFFTKFNYELTPYDLKIYLSTLALDQDLMKEFDFSQKLSPVDFKKVVNICLNFADQKLQSIFYSDWETKFISETQGDFFTFYDRLNLWSYFRDVEWTSTNHLKCPPFRFPLFADEMINGYLRNYYEKWSIILGNEEYRDNPKDSFYGSDNCKFAHVLDLNSNLSEKN